MFIAEVVNVSVDERYMDSRGRLELEKADLIAYSHGEYFALGEKTGRFGYSVRKRDKSREPGKDAGRRSVPKKTAKNIKK